MNPLQRAQGVLYGQTCGDSLGAQVEFLTSEEIARAHPHGVRHMTGGGPHRILAGQLTDDSEMALALAHCLARDGEFQAAQVRAAYEDWAMSDPISIGNTCAQALRLNKLSNASQANGALMRISPLAVAYAHDPETAAMFAARDCRITHPNALVMDINAAYVFTLATIVGQGLDCLEARRVFLGRVALPDLNSIDESHAGWVLVAVKYLLEELERESSFEDAVVNTIARGGDTDTNAAIVGAFFGGIHGVDAIPRSWRETVAACRPDRPAEYWARDLERLAERLLKVG